MREATAAEFPSLEALATAAGLTVDPSRDWSGTAARVWVVEERTAYGARGPDGAGAAPDDVEPAPGADGLSRVAPAPSSSPAEDAPPGETVRPVGAAAECPGGPSGPGSRVVGFLAAWMVADELQIQDVAVIAAARRRGHAGALLRHALGRAQAEGARAAVLEVRAGNHAARALYGAAGFEVARVRRAYYSAPLEDALELSLALASPGASVPPADPP